MTDRPREIWCDTGLYWDYVEDWSEGSWRDNDDSGGEKYVRADRIEELEAELEIALEALEKLARLGNGDRYGSHKGTCDRRNALAELKGETDE